MHHLPFVYTVLRAYRPIPRTVDHSKALVVDADVYAAYDFALSQLAAKPLEPSIALHSYVDL